MPFFREQGEDGLLATVERGNHQLLRSGSEDDWLVRLQARPMNNEEERADNGSLVAIGNSMNFTMNQSSKIDRDKVSGKRLSNIEKNF